MPQRPFIHTDVSQRGGGQRDGHEAIASTRRVDNASFFGGHGQALVCRAKHRTLAAKGEDDLADTG
ncbi:hypothetical protein D3C72_2178380 [compost metagenome]